MGGLDELKARVLELVPIFDRVAKGSKASVESSAKAQIAAEKSAVAQIAKDAQSAAREKEKTMKDATRAAEREAREQLRIKNAINALELREWQKSEREKTRASENEERDRLHAAEEASRKRQRLAEQEAAAAEATLKRRSRGFGSFMGTATSRTLGVAGRVAGIAGALGGGFAIADALGAGIQEEKTAGQLVRSSAETGGFTGPQVQKAARASAIATGTSLEANLEGIDRFIRETGDLKTGVALMQDLARYSAASGASMTDLGTTAGTIFTHMNGDMVETRDTLLALIGQSKTGAIDIRNLAEYGGRLVGTAELFEGGTKGNIETFGALAQLAKRKGGKIDAAEATEAASRIFGEVSMHADEFQGMGVNVKGAGGKLRSVEDILLDTLVKTKGDITAIPHLFGRQAGGVETGLAQAFLEGSGGKTDAASLEAGRKSAAASIQALRRPSSEGEIDEGVKSHLSETNAKLSIATEQFHAAMNDKLLPLMPQMIDQFTQLIPALQRTVDFFTSGSITEGILKGIAVIFGAEVLRGAISKGAESMFTLIGGKFLGLFSAQKTVTANIEAGVVNVMGRGPGGAPPPGGGNTPSPSGSVSSLVQKLGPAAAIIGETSEQAQAMIGGSYVKKLMADTGRAGELAEKIQSGTATPEEREEAKTRLSSIQTQIGAGKAYANEGTIGNFSGDVQALGSDLFGAGGAQDKREQEKAASGHLDTLTAAAQKLAAALDALNAVTQAAPGHVQSFVDSLPKRELGPDWHGNEGF